MLVSLAGPAAHAARNDRILLLLPGEGDWRDEVVAYWNAGVGLEVDMVVDPALGTASTRVDEGMLASFDTPAPGVEWVIVRVSEPGELEARLANLDPGNARIAVMGPHEAFREDPAAAYAQVEVVILDTPALPNDGDRAAFLARARVVATQANHARPGMLMGLTLEPAGDDDEPLMAAHKLFADTRDFIGIFAVDVDAHGPTGMALVDSVAHAGAPGSRGMYMDMMQRPDNVLDPRKEIWMQRGAMILGVITIIGVILIVRFKQPPDPTPPKSG